VDKNRTGNCDAEIFFYLGRES